MPRAKEGIGIDCKEAQRNFEEREQSMIAVVVLQLYTFVKAHPSVSLKSMNFIICKWDTKEAYFFDGGQHDHGRWEYLNSAWTKGD